MFGWGEDRWPGIAKLAEEAGEIGQVIGKLMNRNGRTDHWDGKGPLHERLADEMGDALAAIIFVAEQCVLIKAERVIRRAAWKLRTFRDWHAEANGYTRPALKLEELRIIFEDMAIR